MNKIDRSNVNDSRVKAQDFPKSGFDMSYKSYSDFIMGHLIPAGHQFIMPADKFSGSNDTKYTFNTLQVPEISDVQVSQHNFYVPFRAIDNTFERAMCPTEVNGMSASWRVPAFTLNNIVNDSAFDLTDVIEYYFGAVDSVTVDTLNETTKQTLIGIVLNIIGAIRDSGTAEDFYSQDFFPQWLEFANSELQKMPITAGNSRTKEEYKAQWLCVLTALYQPIIGKGSLLDFLGYAYLRSYDIDYIAGSLANMVFDDEIPVTATTDITDYVSSIPQSEYALRAYYAIWYEHYRDPFLEKRTSDLPDWRDFGSSSIIDGTESSIACYLVPRIRSWQKDMFVGAMPDDISRHVFAPVVVTSDKRVDVSDSDFQYLYSESADYAGKNGLVNMLTQKLSYLNPVSGSVDSVIVPLPKAVNDALNTIDASGDTASVYSLDLRDLRKTQMLERYLKRNFYFGDEYKDRMRAHYGSDVSDNSIRRPHLLSSSVSTLNPKQEVANMTNEITPAGTRVATAQDSASGDGYEFFAEEFGIVINMISIIPKAQYAGITPQHLLSQQTDFPLPEFANNNDEFGRILEIACSGIAYTTDYQIYQFGHYPYAHAWRSRVDEVHGSFLDNRSDYTFRRFFGLDAEQKVPRLNSSFIHCVPNLGMFLNTIRLDGQGYMTVDHHFYVERVLPTPVEEI